MKNIIDRILAKADTAFLETEMVKIGNLDLDKQDISKAIDQMKEEVGFWVRANPFSHKEEKYQLQDLNRERDRFDKDYRSISTELKKYLMTCLKDDRPLAMKTLAGQMEISLQKLYRKIRRHGMNKKGLGGVAQIGQIEEQIKYFNELLYQEYGFPMVSLVSDDIVEATFQYLLDNQLKKNIT